MLYLKQRWQHASASPEAAMNRTDKFLIGIVAAIVILVGAGFTVLRLRPKPGYQPDDTPGGVANNYLLALQRDELDRAYGYVWPKVPGYPDEAYTFGQNVNNSFGYNNQSSVAIQHVTETDETATVTFVETNFSQGGLFGSNSYENTYQMHLVRENGRWWIRQSDAYWAWCLDQPEGCW
jgi:hypothetical protein